jgi:hypothetical protein
VIDRGELIASAVRFGAIDIDDVPARFEGIKKA